jgi:SAM-dependent methyltransferase
MGLYARYLLPRLTHLSMGQKQLLPYRQRVVTGAVGRVLEIGIGSGLNLPLYGDAVEEVIGIDISPELLAMAERGAAMAPPPSSAAAGRLGRTSPMHYRRWQRRHGGRHLGAV